MRYSEGCDQHGHPFVEEEPQPGTHNCEERKDLWTQYKSGTLSKEDCTSALRKLFEGRDPNRLPIVVYSTEVPLGGLMNIGPTASTPGDDTLEVRDGAHPSYSSC